MVVNVSGLSGIVMISSIEEQEDEPMEEDPEEDSKEDMELREDQLAQDVEDEAPGGSSSRFDSGEKPDGESNADYDPARGHQGQVDLGIDLLDSLLLGILLSPCIQYIWFDRHILCR